MEGALVINWVVLSFVIAYAGRNRKIGWAAALFFSLVFSPVIGLIAILVSSKKTSITKQWEDYEEGAKHIAKKGNTKEAIEKYTEVVARIEYSSQKLNKREKETKESIVKRVHSEITSLQNIESERLREEMKSQEDEKRKQELYKALRPLIYNVLDSLPLEERVKYESAYNGKDGKVRKGLYIGRIKEDLIHKFDQEGQELMMEYYKLWEEGLYDSWLGEDPDYKINHWLRISKIKTDTEHSIYSSDADNDLPF